MRSAEITGVGVMQIGFVRSVSYFTIDIADDYIHRLSISFVFMHRGIDFMFFRRPEFKKTFGE